MSIKWLSEEEAEKMFDVTFMDWAKQYGYKGCYDEVETREEVVRARVWAAASPTAKEILNYVLASNKLIYAVGMRGGYQCFNSTEGPDRNLPVVFIDLDGKLTVNVRGPHNLHLDPNKCVGTVEHEGKLYKNEAVTLNNWIALLHEFGHAKQWIETPTMFDNQAGTGKVGKNKAGKNIKIGKHDFDARLAKGTGKGSFAEAIREKAIKLPGNAGIVPTVEEMASFKLPVWGTKIEMDNMARHEWPICRDLGLPLRVNYRDINATSDGSPSLTSQIRQKALVQAKADETLKEKRGPVTAGGLKVKVQCPRCRKMVSKTVLTFPCDNSLHV